MRTGLKRETWRPQPTSSWTPGQASNSREHGPSSTPSAGPSRKPASSPPYLGTAASRAPQQSSSSYQTYDRDDRRDRDSRDGGDRHGRSYRPERDGRVERSIRDRDRAGIGDGRKDVDDRSWSAWKSKVGDIEREDDRRRVDEGDRHGGRSWNTWKGKVEEGDRRRVDRDERRRADMQKEVNQDDGRSWSAWQDKVVGGRRDEDRRRDEGGRRNDDSRKGRDRESGKGEDRADSAYRPSSGVRGSSPSGSMARVPLPRESPPNTGRGRRLSPDYGVGGRRGSPNIIEGGERRPRSSSRRSPSPSTHIDRKRAPTSPRSSNYKRRRDLSPARSAASSHWPKSPSLSPDRLSHSKRRSRSPSRSGQHRRRSSRSVERPHILGQRGDRTVITPSAPRGQQEANRSPRQVSPPQSSVRPSLASQFEMFRSEAQVWRRDEGPAPGRSRNEQLESVSSDVPHTMPAQNNISNNAHSHHSYPPDSHLPFTNGHEQQSKLSMQTGESQVHRNAHSSPVTGPFRIDFSAGSVSPVKGGWKSISTIQAPSAVQYFFEAPSSPSSRKILTQPRASNDRSSSSSPTKSTAHEPEHDIYLDRIADAEKQYSQHLSTIAPYIQAAFTQWYVQDVTPALPEFLVHYFGRPPNGSELQQIQQLLSLKTQLARDQEDLNQHHAQTVKVEASSRLANGHWSPPGTQLRGRQASGRSSGRSSRSPIKQTINSNQVPLPDSSRYVRRHSESTPARPLEELPAKTEPAQPFEPTGPSPSTETPPSRRSDPQTLSRSFRSHRVDGDTYERLTCVGEGTYGKVYKARNVESGAFVALKRIRMEGEKDGFPVTAMREIKLLQTLRDDNVVCLHEMMVSKGSVYMVLEYMDHDLTGLLAHPEVTFTAANVKSLTHQMLSGLSYLHKRAILHRDMKGSNILLNARGELKLADFGLARAYHRHRRNDYTNRVITLWYRSPELLLGETVYGPEVDLWSAGCIMLELFLTKPVFQGKDEIHQLEVIYSVMGTPSESDWPGVKDLPWYELVKPKEALPSRFRGYFAKWLSPAALDLTEGLLLYNPEKRLTADSALKTAYFNYEDPDMDKPTQLAGCGEHHEMSAKLEKQRRRQEGK